MLISQSKTFISNSCIFFLGNRALRKFICLIKLLLAHLREILNTYIYIINTEKYSLRDFPNI